MDTAKLLEWWEKQGRFGLIGVGIGLIFLGGWWMISNYRTSASDVQFYSVQETDSETSSQAEKLIVDVRGAVKSPGVFELEVGSRLHQAVSAGGGFSENADRNWIDKNLNMARQLTDGEKIYIPEEGEYSSVQAPSVQNNNNIKSGKFVNLNSATQEQLETLSGIGPAFAQRIIDYRQANGGFKSIEEIQAVSGIGEKTFEKIKDQISI
jgi:competence protein ComEA